MVDLREECWQPLIYYRASLLAAAAEGDDAVSYISSDRKPYLPNRSPFSKQKLDGSTLKNIFTSQLSSRTSCFIYVSVFFRKQVPLCS